MREIKRRPCVEGFAMRKAEIQFESEAFNTLVSMATGVLLTESEADDLYIEGNAEDKREEVFMFRGGVC